MEGDANVPRAFDSDEVALFQTMAKLFFFFFFLNFYGTAWRELRRSSTLFNRLLAASLVDRSS